MGMVIDVKGVNLITGLHVWMLGDRIFQASGTSFVQEFHTSHQLFVYIQRSAQQEFGGIRAQV